MEAEVQIRGNSLEKRIVDAEMFGSGEDRGDEKREVDADRIESEDDANGKEICVNGEEKRGTGYNQDKPPEDDCCPICFGDFNVPCKANCGHWFCGSCILQLWKYQSRPRQCKCPFCSSAISKLTAEASVARNTDKKVVEALEEIEQYNHFYVKGLKGFVLILVFYARKHGPFLHVYAWRLLRALFMVVIATPSFIKRAFVDLIRHPQRIRLNYQRVRLIACTVSLLLHFYHGFLAPGRLKLQITKMRLVINCASILLVVLPYTAVMCKTWLHIWWLRFRIWQVRREVEALRAQNAALREQEEALRVQANGLRQEESALEGNTVLVAQNHAVVQAEVDLARNALDRALEKPDASIQIKTGAHSQAEADSMQTQDEAALRLEIEASQARSTNTIPETEHSNCRE